MAIPPDDGSKPTGFAGLDSLVSNVESDLTPSPSAPSSDADSDTDGKSRVESERIDSQPVVTASTAHESPKIEGVPSQSSGARWAVAVVVGIGAIILFANIERKGDGPAYSPTEAPVASIPSVSSQPSPELDASAEEMPPTGEGLVLNGPQIRWCVFEKARLETMKDLISEDQEISAFNTFVGRYNERCTRFQYRQGLLEVIEGELNREGKRLQAEGAERILSLRSPSRIPDARETPTEQTLRAPKQETASESPREELAKAAVVVPAPVAKSEISAPPTATSNRDPLGEIEIVRSDFGLFSPPQSGKPAFQASRKVPLQEKQGYGWFVELKTTKPRIKWREELVVPTPPATWGIQGSTAQHSVSDDGRTLTTEREVVPNRGIIYNVWSVAPGDPKGPHVVRVYVEGKLVRTFDFETE